MTAVGADSPPLPKFSIRMFGGLAISVQGEPLPICHSRAEHLLLALLTLKQIAVAEPVAVARESLFSALYPTNDNAAQAGQNLRSLLAALRKTLGAEAGRLPARGVRALSLDLADAYIDVAAFDALAAQNDAAQLQQALSLYCGPLLPECGAHWVELERKRRQKKFHQAVEKLCSLHIAQGDCDAALKCVGEARQVDWEWEPTLRVQMNAYRAVGKPLEALRAYKAFCKRLKREQGREPQRETRQLEEEIGRRISLVPPPAECEPPRPLIQMTDLIGRESDLKAIEAEVCSHPMVTLTGAGGVGKTQLALRVAANLQREFKSGVAVVELAGTAKTANVMTLARAVAESLGLREETGRLPTHLLTAYFQSRNLLLVLDNCEHVADGCASLAQELLAHCPHLHLLVTSQHPLRAGKGRVRDVLPLAAPHPDSLPVHDADVPDAIRDNPAVRLFVERARHVIADFTLTPDNARRVAQICCALDGIPLAILLAAVRVRGLAVKDIAERLQQRFDLLTQGESGAPHRQQTLEAAIAWSYELLTPREQMLQCLLPVFHGGWTLEAAEGVCSGGKLSKTAVADLLGSLVEKSLVVRDNATPEPRYRMLESIRAYCSEKLCAATDHAAICLRHAAWYAGFAERNEAGLRGAEQLAHLRLFDAEQENLRAALDWLAEHPGARGADKNNGGSKPDSSPDAGIAEDVELRLVAALGLFWWIRGHFREGSERALAALQGTGNAALQGTDGHGRTRIRALLCAGILSDYVDAYTPSRTLLEEAQAQTEQTGDRWLMGLVLTQLGYVHRNDWEKASGYLNNALTLARQVGDPWLKAEALSTFGFVEFYYGNRERARELLQEGLVLCRALGDSWLLSEFTYHNGLLAFDQRDWAGARRMLEESLRLSEPLRDRQGACMAHIGLARILYREGNAESAAQCFLRSMQSGLEADYKRGVGGALDGLARLAFQEGAWERAACLFGAAETHSATGLALLFDHWRQEREDMMARLRAELGENTFDYNRNAGLGLSSEQAAAFVQKQA